MTSQRKRSLEEPVLLDMIGKLVPVYHPLKIYLFGSRARGSASPDSDYDLLILVPDDAPDSLKTAGNAYRALWGITVPVDVVVMTKSYFDNSVDIQNSLAAEVMREGRALHVA
jgi:uncharacterized protein